MPLMIYFCNNNVMIIAGVMTTMVAANMRPHLISAPDTKYCKVTGSVRVWVPLSIKANW